MQIIFTIAISNNRAINKRRMRLKKFNFTDDLRLILPLDNIPIIFKSIINYIGDIDPRKKSCEFDELDNVINLIIKEWFGDFVF